MKPINLLFSGSILLILSILSSCKKNIIEPTLSGKNLTRSDKLVSLAASSTGTWTKLTNQPMYAFSSVAILLSDGTVAVKTTGPSNYGNVWLKLTPDVTGSYVNGTWSNTIAPMADTRHDFSSQLLPNGKLYAAGGEYGTGAATAEVYDPVSNAWTTTSTPAGSMLDASSQLLNDGTILQNFVGLNGSTACSIYNPSTNNWSPVFNSLHSLDEGHFVQQPDQSVLNIDIGGATAERYIPSLGKWIADAPPVNNLYGPDGEMGAGFLLPNLKTFFMGANGKTTYYTPSNSQSPGSWTAGPGTPGGLGADDAGAAFMINGKIIYALGPAPTRRKSYQSPTTFFEFDYTTNTYTQITAPGGTTTYAAPTFECNFLQLPDGSLLFATMYSATGFYIYTPGGTQITAGVPTITNVANTGTRTYTITGTGFRGINTGAAYGDDAQNNTNYPIVRLTFGSNVYYARTYNWTLTGTNSVQVSMPNAIPSGTYAMTVTVNGFSSTPTNITF